MDKNFKWIIMECYHCGEVFAIPEYTFDQRCCDTSSKIYCNYCNEKIYMCDATQGRMNGNRGLIIKTTTILSD